MSQLIYYSSVVYKIWELDENYYKTLFEYSLSEIKKLNFV